MDPPTAAACRGTRRRPPRPPFGGRRPRRSGASPAEAWRPERVRHHHDFNLGGVGGVVAGDAAKARAECAARRRRAGNAESEGAEAESQPDGQSRLGRAGGEGDLPGEIVVEGRPVVARGRFQRNRHRHRLGRGAAAGQRVVDIVEPAGRLGPVGCDGNRADGAARHGVRARGIGGAGQTYQSHQSPRTATILKVAGRPGRDRIIGAVLCTASLLAALVLVLSACPGPWSHSRSA